ncbi:rRNA pseudouridine synthase [Desulfovibrio sp. OttesenSCG-928-G15]|nr:rRNA pseudouridine synthase [Desulfovibrio sp. OttesenSCG-928-G15]
MNAIRLNKALAMAGICSRRRADELISAGAVTVNGQSCTELGLRVDPTSDIVSVHGKVVSFPTEEDRHCYLMLHKPIQVVCTAKDPEGRPTVLDYLPAKYRQARLYPVGRLDYFSEGLLILTDDGELTNRMTHPSHHLPKTYEVLLRERPQSAMLEAMRNGMTLAEGERLAPVETRYDPDRKTLVLILRQGINRQIRRMCRDFGLTILRLQRVAIGPLSLGSLPKGECRPLHENEVAALKKATGLTA